MLDNLEFHYLIGCRHGKWYAAGDTETAVMPDGTVYDWDTNEWIPLNDEDTPEAMELDIQQYRLLLSALRMLNEGVINA